MNVSATIGPTLMLPPAWTSGSFQTQLFVNGLDRGL